MYTDKLLQTDPFEFTTANRQIFVDSVRECALHHYKNNNYIKFLWDKNSFSPDQIQAESDLAAMPFTMVNLFKNHELYSGSMKDIVLTLGSSGTSGQRSQIFLNQASLDNVKKLAYNIHQSLGITSDKKYNYVCFTYDPEVANDLGTAFTDELLTSFTGKEEVFYTFKHDGNDFYFDEEGTVEAFRRMEKSSLSTRVLGFPAFLYEIINKYNLQLNLGPDSWVQTGGGWKGHADKEIPKDEFREMVSKALGLPKENIRDLFGMVEHGIPYVDAPDGKLRIPNYARVLIRDPKTLEVLPYGETGLIQFICSYNTSYPAMSLLTTDWGRVEHGESYGDILNITGRAGVTKNKGCAIKAMELLK